MQKLPQLCQNNAGRQGQKTGLEMQEMRRSDEAVQVITPTQTKTTAAEHVMLRGRFSFILS